MGRGEGGNEKWEQSRDLEMKLLIGLRLVTTTIFQFDLEHSCIVIHTG